MLIDAYISTTVDLFGHLMPGGVCEALVLIDAYDERAAAASTD